MLFADYRVGGGGSQADDDLRVYERELGVQPRMARDNFRFRWLLVNTPLSPLFEFEVFDGVGDVNIRTVDAGVFKRTGQQTPGGSDERLPGQIFPCRRAARPPSRCGQSTGLHLEPLAWRGGRVHSLCIPVRPRAIALTLRLAARTARHRPAWVSWHSTCSFTVMIRKLKKRRISSLFPQSGSANRKTQKPGYFQHARRGRKARTRRTVFQACALTRITPHRGLRECAPP